MTGAIKQGHVCPRCFGDESLVEKTKVDPRGYYRGWRYRRRRCKECGARWVTVELNYWDFESLIKEGEGA